jgi:hypothetical protein
MLEEIMNKKFNKNENILIRKRLFMDSESNNSLKDIDSEVIDDEIKFDKIDKDIIDNMSYSDSHASSCSDDTWHERLYTDYEYLSEISDIHSNLSDIRGDSLHEYLFERYYKARNLIAKMRKETIIYLFIESLSKYTKKDYEFIKQYKHNLNQEIVKKYVNMFILKKNM